MLLVSSYFGLALMFHLLYRFDNVEESNIPSNKRQNEVLSRRDKPKRMKFSGPDACAVFNFFPFKCQPSAHDSNKILFPTSISDVRCDLLFQFFVMLPTYHGFDETFLGCMVIKLTCRDTSLSSKLSYIYRASSP